MSTFEGKLLEESLDFIRIDEFQSRNHDGTSFFLSHFHSDHFRGLFNDKFVKELVKSDNKMLFCSAYTKTLILRKSSLMGINFPSHKICSLTANAPYLLLNGDHESVQVTTIPAGHCPGSVMFLFEQGGIRVLYTGDFRLDPRELCKYNALHDKSGIVKPIKTLYLDTTFCYPSMLSFPSRQQTLEDLTALVTDWLDKSPKHEVGIWYNSYHGLEPLLIELASVIKTLIWIVDPETYINYAAIPELQYHLSRKHTGRIHVCPVIQQGDCETCAHNRVNTKTIKPCAQSFHRQQLELSRQKEGKNGVMRIAYSMHCSLEELIGMVKYLSPEAVYPCVLPSELTSEQVLQNLLLDIDKLKLELEEKENFPSKESSSPPKKFCEAQKAKNEDIYSTMSCSILTDQTEEDGVEIIIISSEDEEEFEKPLSQNDLFRLDTPPL